MSAGLDFPSPRLRRGGPGWGAFMPDTDFGNGFQIAEVQCNLIVEGGCVMSQFQSDYAISLGKRKAIEVLRALAHTNCEQRHRMARALRILILIEAQTSETIPPHAKSLIKALETEISKFNHSSSEWPFDQVYHFLKKRRSSKQREQITESIITASYDILTQ